jgi:hypothetical protein
MGIRDTHPVVSKSVTESASYGRAARTALSETSRAALFIAQTSPVIIEEVITSHTRGREAVWKRANGVTRYSPAGSGQTYKEQRSLSPKNNWADTRALSAH